MLTHQAFIYLLEQQPTLFSEPDRQALVALMPTLPDDLKAIANALANWSKTRPGIRKALLPLISAGEMGLNPHIKVVDEAKEYKEQIINALLQSKPAPTLTTPSDKPKGILTGLVSFVSQLINKK